jgi:DNA polymerase III delta prime subunit
VSGEDIIKQVSSQIYEMEIPEKSKAELIEKIGEYEFRMQSATSRYR